MIFNPVIPIVTMPPLPKKTMDEDIVINILQVVKNIESYSNGIHSVNTIWLSADLEDYSASLYGQFDQRFDIAIIPALPAATSIIFEKSEKNMQNPDSIDWLMDGGVVYYPWAVRIVRGIGDELTQYR